MGPTGREAALLASTHPCAPDLPEDPGAPSLHSVGHTGLAVLSRVSGLEIGAAQPQGAGVGLPGGGSARRVGPLSS